MNVFLEMDPHTTTLGVTDTGTIYGAPPVNPLHGSQTTDASIGGELHSRALDWLLNLGEENKGITTGIGVSGSAGGSSINMPEAPAPGQADPLLKFGPQILLKSNSTQGR